jgi:uncharacterized protein (DUF433 family)
MTDRTALLRRITQTLGKCGGGPCIGGMRICVSDILETLADYITPTEILADFPDLEREDIQACLLLASVSIDFPWSAV